MNEDQIDYRDLRLGRGAPAILEASVLLTLVGAGLILLGFPLLAFGGGVFIFGMILLVLGVVAFLYGTFQGGVLVIAGYLYDFKKHWQPHYKKAALLGALVGLFLSLLYLPATPILMLAGAAIAVALARKDEGDTALPSFPPEDSDTYEAQIHQVPEEHSPHARL